ncbi:MAG: hypothetical protein Q9169_006573 [Polycauliona sp. 2 TL-2023]
MLENQSSNSLLIQSYSDATSSLSRAFTRMPSSSAARAAVQPWITSPSPRRLELVFTIVTVAFTLCVWNYFKYVQRRRTDSAFAAQHGCKPTRSVFPYKWPFALDLLYRQYHVNKTRKLLAFQSSFFDRLGPTIEMHLFGDVGFLTFDPANVESILATNFEDYVLGSRSDALRAFLGEGIFTQDGARWKHSREMLRRPFVKMHYQNLTSFGEHVEDLIQSLKQCSGVVDLQPYCFRFTLATTTALIFGQPIKDYGNDTQHQFAMGFDYASLVSAVRIRLADFYWVYSPSGFTQSCTTVKEYATMFVDQAMKDRADATKMADERYAFIQDLYDEYKDPILVRDQLVNVLIAGRDTTAALLSWTFFLLVRHPPVLARLRQEISSVVGDNVTLDRSHIQRLRWLRCVINETNRLYPQLPVNVRIATKNTIIPKGGGADGQSPVMIPKGKGVGWSTYHMHRQKELYGPDAESYRPERFETGELDNIGWGFMPFHGGPRMCLGKDFALMETSCVVVRILQSFPNLRLPDHVLVEPTGQEQQSLGILITSAEGCKTLSLLITANHILDYYNVVTGYGHISARNPLNNATFFMTGNGVPPALIRSPEDIDEFYIADASPAGNGTAPPMATSERFIHQALLKRFPSLNSVIHSHSRSVIPFGIGGVPFQATYHTGGFIGEQAPVFDIADYYTAKDTHNMLVNQPRLGEALASTFLTSAHNTSAATNGVDPDYKLSLQRGHGFTTIGTSIAQAVYRAVLTSWNAEVQASAVTINDAAGQNRGVRYIVGQEVADTAGLDDDAREFRLWAAQVGVNPLYQNGLGYVEVPKLGSG